MPHLVTKKGAGRVRVGGVDLPEGAPLDASNWSTRSTYEARGFIRFVTDDEYRGALELQKAAEEAKRKAENPFADFTEAVQKSLADANIKTVAEAKSKGKDELVKLDDIGAATADKILALETA